MKLSFACLLVASAAAIKLSDPKDAYAGRQKNLDVGLKAIAEQQKFEAKHESTHAAAMEKAD